MSVATMGERVMGCFEPIVVLEWRRMMRHGVRPVYSIIGGPIFGLLLMAILRGSKPDDLTLGLGALAFICMVFSAVFVATQGARAIASEQERSTFDFLAICSLRSAQITDQKIAVAALQMVGFLLFLSPVFLVLAVLSAVPVVNVVLLLALLLLATLSVSSLSVAVSCIVRSPGVAVVLVFVVMLVLGSAPSVAGLGAGILLLAGFYAAVTRSLGRILGAEKRLAPLYGLPVAVGLLVLLGAYAPASQCVSGALTFASRCARVWPEIGWLSGFDESGSGVDGYWPLAVAMGTVAMQVVFIMLCRWAAAYGFHSMRRREE